MSKKRNNNSDNKTSERKIRQVFPGEEGNVKEPKSEVKPKEDLRKEETAEAIFVIRIVSVVVAMIFSLLLHAFLLMYNLLFHP